MNRLLPMINAELLKLRKRRGLFWFSLFLSAGIIAVANGVAYAYHVSDPARYAAPGGLDGFEGFLTIFSVMGGLAAVLVGATAGAQDVETGVFRSLVCTGQSRIRIALVRLPGALMLLVPMLALGFALEVAAAFLLAGGKPLPDPGSILTAAGWLAATLILDLALALGVAALLRSRGTAIGIIIAWQLVGSRIIESIGAFGGFRALVSTVALDRFLPGATDTVHILRGDTLTVTLAGAAIIVAAWILVATGVGVWRTATQDA